MLKEVRKLLGVLNYYNWGWDSFIDECGNFKMSVILGNQTYDLNVQDDASDADKEYIKKVTGLVYEANGYDIEKDNFDISNKYAEFVDVVIKNKLTLRVLTPDDYYCEFVRPARARGRQVIEFDEPVVTIIIGNEGYVFPVSSEYMMVELVEFIDKVKYNL